MSRISVRGALTAESLPHTLGSDNHPDTVITNPVNNDVLTYQTSTDTWRNKVVPGEINLGANVGGQTGEIFRDKTGVTLNFKTVESSDSSITVTNNADDIDLVVATAPVGNHNIIGSEHDDTQLVGGALRDGQLFLWDNLSARWENTYSTETSYSYIYLDDTQPLVLARNFATDANFPASDTTQVFLSFFDGNNNDISGALFAELPTKNCIFITEGENRANTAELRIDSFVQDGANSKFDINVSFLQGNISNWIDGTHYSITFQTNPSIIQTDLQAGIDTTAYPKAGEQVMATDEDKKINYNDGLNMQKVVSWVPNNEYTFAELNNQPLIMAHYNASDITGSPGSFVWVDEIPTGDMDLQVSGNLTLGTLGGTLDFVDFANVTGNPAVNNYMALRVVSVAGPFAGYDTNDGFVVWRVMDSVQVSSEIAWDESTGFSRLRYIITAGGFLNMVQTLNWFPNTTTTFDIVTASASDRVITVIRFKRSTNEWTMWANGAIIIPPVVAPVTPPALSELILINLATRTGDLSPPAVARWFDAGCFDVALIDGDINRLNVALSNEYQSTPIAFGPDGVANMALTQLSDVLVNQGLGNTVGDRLTYAGFSYDFVLKPWINLSLVNGAITFEDVVSPLIIADPSSFTLIPFVGVLQAGAFQITTNNLGRLVNSDGFTWTFTIFFSAAIAGGNAVEFEVALFLNGSKVSNSYLTTMAANNRFNSISGSWKQNLNGTSVSGPAVANQFVEIFIKRNLGSGDAQIGSSFISIDAIRLQDKPTS